MRKIEVSPMVAEAARWLEQTIENTDYGECSVVIRLHKGRVPMVEYSQTTKVKTSEPHAGMTGGKHEKPDR